MASITVDERDEPGAPGAVSRCLDALLAGILFAGTLFMLSRGGMRELLSGADRDAQDLDALGVVLAAASTLPVVAWRSRPMPVLVVTAAASALLVGVGYPLDLTLGAPVALYLMVAHRDRDDRWSTRRTLAVAGLFVAYLVAAAAEQRTFPWVELLHSGLAWSVAWFAGERTRLRREHIADLRQRASRTEREAERERLLAAANERARIARDLHDSAGHAVNVIAVRAGAARLRHRDDPARSLAALEEIERLARETAAEIDQIVGSLRAAGPAGPGAGEAVDAVEAPVGLASLDTLIARHTSNGLDVTVALAGSPRPLGDAADQAAYRILQEALTNAARHGAGAACVELTYGRTALHLAVTNPVGRAAPRTGATESRPGGGHGLVGMRERATLLGGDLDARELDGTFRVRARIPDRGAPGR